MLNLILIVIIAVGIIGILGFAAYTFFDPFAVLDWYDLFAEILRPWQVKVGFVVIFALVLIALSESDNKKQAKKRAKVMLDEGKIDNLSRKSLNKLLFMRYN